MQRISLSVCGAVVCARVSIVVFRILIIVRAIRARGAVGLVGIAPGIALVVVEQRL